MGQSTVLQSLEAEGMHNLTFQALLDYSPVPPGPEGLVGPGWGVERVWVILQAEHSGGHVVQH